MRNYRLKPEATPFFKEKHATTIQTFDYWEKLGVDPKALEEVEDAYITYGHKDRNNKGASLSGWSQDDGQHFYFTIHFPSVRYKEHDEFGNGKIIRELMNKIQGQLNYFLTDFMNESN